MYSHTYTHTQTDTHTHTLSLPTHAHTRTHTHTLSRTHHHAYVRTSGLTASLDEYDDEDADEGVTGQSVALKHVGRHGRTYKRTRLFH